MWRIACAHVACVCQHAACWYEQTDAVPSFKKHHLQAEIKTLCCFSTLQLCLTYSNLTKMYKRHMNFETVSAVLAVCVSVDVHVWIRDTETDLMNVFVCVFTFAWKASRELVLCIVELVQRLSFGLLIPFYSTGIMCYSNPSPIWGVWRWHEDDVTVRTRGETENHRPTLSMRDRLLLAACSSDYTENLCPQQIIAVRGKNIYLMRVTSSPKIEEKSIFGVHWRGCIVETIQQVSRLHRH